MGREGFRRVREGIACLPRRCRGVIVSRDDFLFVGKRGQHYVIVRRSASLDYTDRLRKDEVAAATATEPSAAVLMANRLQHEENTEYGVMVADKVARELGW
jgi:hypothetical protein